MRAIRRQTHQSWSNIRKAARSLQGFGHEPFGTPNVENTAKSCVRKIHREVGLSFAEIEVLGQRVGLVSSSPLSFPSPLPTLILRQKATGLAQCAKRFPRTRGDRPAWER